MDEQSQREQEARRIAEGAEPTPPPAPPPEHEEALARTALGDGSLEKGRKHYEAGAYAEALDAFLAARRRDPSDPQAALLLGLAYLRLDDPGKAAGAWADYVERAKGEKLAGDVAKYITILLHEANHRAARDAIALERQLPQPRVDPRAVAVAPLQNLGSAEYAPLGKSLAAMLIDNLQALPEVTVLERERVQALVDEAKLAEAGLVEASTAVRAGRLLRAGKVAAGSHIDYTASPTHLKLEAVLLDVDEARQLAEASRESPVERFYELVPAIASEFVPVLTRKTVGELPPDRQTRVQQPHTKSLPAALAFGRALEAKDRKDAEEARRQCEQAEKEDPDFELAKRVCGLIPPVWMSTQAVATAVETQVLVAAATAGWAPWVVGGLVAGGAAAGGAVAASGGGGGGGGRGERVTEGGGNNAPGLQGVPGSSTVAVGSTLSYDVSSNDPDGNRVTLSARNLPPNSSFTQTSGALSTGRFTFRPDSSQENQTFIVTFCATDDGSPPAERCLDSSIRVLPRPTPTPREPTPPPCDPLGETCRNNSDCCSGSCDFTDASPTSAVCCSPLGASCSAAAGGSPCCSPEAVCDEGTGKCCLEGNATCHKDSDCCSGDCNTDGFCN
jgi:tetratricopeptide (TPR) repeat protein